MNPSTKIEQPDVDCHPLFPGIRPGMLFAFGPLVLKAVHRLGGCWWQCLMVGSKHETWIPVSERALASARYIMSPLPDPPPVVPILHRRQAEPIPRHD